MTDEPQYMMEDAEPEQPMEQVAVTLPPKGTQAHNWVDRGLKLSCEGADHPHHQSWKVSMRI